MDHDPPFPWTHEAPVLKSTPSDEAGTKRRCLLCWSWDLEKQNPQKVTVTALLQRLHRICLEYTTIFLTWDLEKQNPQKVTVTALLKRLHRICLEYTTIVLTWDLEKTKSTESNSNNALLCYSTFVVLAFPLVSHPHQPLSQLE
ncbi:hypothetical protein ElyMa_004361600 [Elysia marginata]|uniref:Uncharacterized protein n=1 Tax=Elysia marginata TaxID=1093978 RepID=A0AAV4H5B1_9GAST|nr:hypothetical protein ElyMa_004361600 [Elysia marginata]